MKNREGFTLVELLIVSLLGLVLLGSIYQTLRVQERSYRRTGALIESHDALRTAMGVLEAELREVAADADGTQGQSDLNIIAGDSVEFRAFRKTAITCAVQSASSKLDLWLLGESFSNADSVLVFVDGDSTAVTDDRWMLTAVNGTGSVSSSACATRWPGPDRQGVNVPDPGGLFAGVRAGAPVRGFEWVTYSVGWTGSDWALRRRNRGHDPVTLVEGLANPDNTGPIFRYYDSTGAETATAADVVRIQITLYAPANEGADIPADTLTSTLYLRNN